ncbi:MAG: zinc ribbon domain-containing protein [Phycisphaerales bacterium]|nr:zinc ribbon domain-containing protein [Phycisphaerales bacterium]
MPTYEYRCDACAHQFEEFQSITAAPLRKCPKCGKSKLRRLIGAGGGVIFKGGGFYETDYRSDGYKKAAEAEKKSAEPASEKKAEVKSEPAKAERTAGDASAKNKETVASTDGGKTKKGGGKGSKRK